MTILDGWSISLFRDHLQSVAYMRFEFPLRGGGRGQLLLPMNLTAHPKKTFEALLRSGADLYLGEPGQKFVSRLIQKLPERMGHLASRSGWHDEGFLLGPKVIGAGPDDLMLNPVLAPELEQHFRSCGNIHEWTETIGKVAAKSTLMSFAIMAALAAPLLRHSRASEGVLFNLVGENSLGKTTALRAAASVTGPADDLLSWAVSDRGVHERAALMSDLPLILDDLEKLEVQANRAARISQIVHTLSSGRSKAISARVENYPQLKWCFLGLSSSRISLSEEFGQTRSGQLSGGTAVRWIDLHVSTEGNGIWDRTKEQGAQLAGYVAEALRQNHGVVMERWLRAVNKNRADLPALLKQAEEAFVSRVCPASTFSTRRVAVKFSVAWAAGVWAIKLGLLPWPKKFAREVCGELFNQYLTSSAALNASIKAAIEKFLELLGDEELLPMTTDQPVKLRRENDPGFRTSVHGDELAYIRQSAVRESCGQFMEAILQRLRSTGALLEGQGGRSGKQVRVQLDGTIGKVRFLAINVGQARESLLDMCASVSMDG